MAAYHVYCYATCTFSSTSTCPCPCIYSQSALGWDYQADLAKHGSQTDASKGFGGKYGVQKDLKDKVHVYVIGSMCV